MKTDLENSQMKSNMASLIGTNGPASDIAYQADHTNT